MAGAALAGHSDHSWPSLLVGPEADVVLAWPAGHRDRAMRPATGQRLARHAAATGYTGVDSVTSVRPSQTVMGLVVLLNVPVLLV